MPANGTVNQGFLITLSQLSLLPNRKLQYVVSNVVKKAEDSVVVLSGLANTRDGTDM